MADFNLSAELQKINDVGIPEFKTLPVVKLSNLEVDVKYPIEEMYAGMSQYGRYVIVATSQNMIFLSKRMVHAITHQFVVEFKPQTLTLVNKGSINKNEMEVCLENSDDCTSSNNENSDANMDENQEISANDSISFANNYYNKMASNSELILKSTLKFTSDGVFIETGYSIHLNFEPFIKTYSSQSNYNHIFVTEDDWVALLELQLIIYSTTSTETHF
ncbi:hypothetical protein FQA39_LY11111 [Lamprigera yunnana]|nr:hypothetical protein FQA39_LY11111 [Lamprigera yunnana]